MNVIKVKKFFYYLFHWDKAFTMVKMKRLYNKKNNKLSDEDYLKRMFRIKMGYKLDLSEPKTFNEKINWLKLFNREDIYTTMVDKHAVKNFVSQRIGPEYVIEELGVYSSSEEIDLNRLPNKFVLKTTHGCGCMIVCKDKNAIKWSEELKKMDDSLKDNYYYHCREWVYKNVPPRIIAEVYMKDNKYDVLPVYKFFCFNGNPFLIQAIQNDKQPNETIDYFDTTWKLLKLRQNFPNSKTPFECPPNLNEMLEIASKLTKGIPFVRCDLYSINGKTYFSEFTFYSDAGFERFHPKKWDLELGNLIELPQKDNK